MQKPINYLDFFTFALSQPVAVLENGYYLEDVKANLMENNIFPLVYIRDENNPIFKQTVEHFKKIGIKQKVLLIILPIVYTKENNT